MNARMQLSEVASMLLRGPAARSAHGLAGRVVPLLSPRTTRGHAVVGHIAVVEFRVALFG